MSIFNSIIAGGGSGTWRTVSCTVSTGSSGTVSFNTTAKAKCFVIHWIAGGVSSSYQIQSGMTVGAIYTGGSSATEFNIRYSGGACTASTSAAEPVITDSSVIIGATYPVGNWTAYYLV